MTPVLAAGLAFTGLLTALTAVWLIQLRSRNAALVDAVWALATGAVGVAYAAVGPAPASCRALLALMAGLWGLRLGLHLLWRMRGRVEDARYAALRRQWGAAAGPRMLGLFWLQAVIALGLSIGFLGAAFRSGAPPLAAEISAVGIWLLALLGEALADAQLERFRQDPAQQGRVCRRGLWRYSRHPNYFFECLHWLAYVGLAWGSAWQWAACISPLLMAFLLLRLSGIPLVEAQAVVARPEYAEYLRTTSALIPWPPRKWAPPPGRRP